MNTSVNSTGYSAFEILYGDRLAFPLSTHTPESDIQGIPKTMHTYVNNLHTRLNVILQCVHTNTKHYKTQMLRSANESTRSLNLTVGDYVFLHKEPTGSIVTSKKSPGATCKSEQCTFFYWSYHYIYIVYTCRMAQSDVGL